MSTEAIPASPAPLSADEAEAMLQRRLKKHDVAIVLLHWFNAATWVLLVATGAALVVSPYFRIAPEWYTTLVESIFGGRASLHFTAVGLVVSGLMIHVYMAAVFPEEKPAFFSMITGSVHELHAYSHHFKWWKEEKAKQLALRARREGARAAAPSAAAPEAKGPEKAPSPGAGRA